MDRGHLPVFNAICQVAPFIAGKEQQPSEVKAKSGQKAGNAKSLSATKNNKVTVSG